MKEIKQTSVTTEDIADLVEFSINETKPKVKTKRGIGNEIELKLDRRKFIVTVTKSKRKPNRLLKDDKN